VDEREHLLHELVAVSGIQRRSVIRMRVHSLDNRIARCRLDHCRAVGLRGIGYRHCNFAVGLLARTVGFNLDSL